MPSKEWIPEYFNYKGFYSVVLVALVDAEYKLIWADLGSTGSVHSTQIYNSSEIKELAEDGIIGFHAPDPLPNDYQDVPRISSLAMMLLPSEIP